MSIKSLLGINKQGKKEKDEGPPKPQIPSVREIIDDIAHIKKNDPILALAAVVTQNKPSSGSGARHSLVDSDIHGLMEAMNKRRRRESQQGLATNPPSSSRSRRRSSSVDVDTNRREDYSNNEKDKQATTKNDKLTYEKLKHFITTCDHSEELIKKLEDKIATLETEIAQHTGVPLRKGDEEIRSSDDAEEESNLL